MIGEFGIDLDERRCGGEAGRRLLQVRQRPLARDVQDAGGQGALRRVRRAGRQVRERREERSSTASLRPRPPPAPTSPKAANFYTSWMDEAALETRGVEPLKPYLAEINGITDKADLLKVIAKVGYASPFGLGIEADTADPKRYAVWARRAASACRTATTTSRRARSTTPIAPRTKPMSPRSSNCWATRHARQFGRHGDQVRDRGRQGPLDAGGSARHGQGLQGHGRGCASRSSRRTSISRSSRQDAGIPQITTTVAYGDTSITAAPSWWTTQPLDGLEEVPRLPHRVGQRGLPDQGVRRRPLRLLQQDARRA